jgi:hypothetical protein
MNRFALAPRARTDKSRGSTRNNSLMRIPTIGLALFVLALSGTARAGDWPGWRGPHGDGTADEKGVPVRWGATDNVAWKTAIPGKGHSSPVVCGDRVFLTTCLEEDAKGPDDPARRLLLCLDRRDGRVLWQKVILAAKLEKLHRLNSRASSTPAADGKYVFVTFLDAGRDHDAKVIVAAYDFDGREVWRKSPGRFSSVHGYCSSPVLYKDTLTLTATTTATATSSHWPKAPASRAGASSGPTRRAPTAPRSSWTPPARSSSS